MRPKDSEPSRSWRLLCTNEQSEDSGSQPFAGLETTWTEFYRLQTERLYRSAAQIGVPSDQIADVVQEVWLDAWKHREGFQGKDVDQRLSSWLSTVVVHKSIDALRRGRRRQAGALDDLLAEPMDDGAEDPVERMEARERDENLSATLDGLRKEDSLNCRLVCERLIVGRSLPDLAADTGLGINSIACRISRTLKKLRVRLRE